MNRLYIFPFVFDTEVFMIRFLKTVSGLLFALTCINAWAMSSFSNVVTFGDSLSDIGNLPMSSEIYIDPHKSHEDVSNLIDTLYVAVSNPVNLSDEAYSVPITQIFHLAHNPYDYHGFMQREKLGHFLPAQPVLDSTPRTYHSMNWNEFFLADAYQDGLTTSQSLIPWSYFPTNATTTTQDSLNYAWAAALSGNACYNKDWVTFPEPCDEAHIVASLQQFKKIADINNVMIPGLLAQIHLFINDVEQRRVSASPQSIYTVWIGGNDLAKNFDLIQHGPSLAAKLAGLKALLFSISWNNYLALSLLAKDPNVQAKHIYLFETFDVTLTPRVYHWSKPLQLIGTFFVDIYNAELRLVVDMVRARYPQVSVHIVPTRQWLKDMASGTGPYQSLNFKAHLGEACQLSSEDYLHPNASPKNCEGYLFWNDIHPAMPTEQLFGYLFEQLVARTFDAPPPATEHPEYANASEDQLQGILKHQVEKDAIDWIKKKL
jgi:phospholipase/lecithinase/hemolysin